MTGNVKDIITISFASVGAVLGVINTVHAFNQDRLRLIVRAKHAYFVPYGVPGAKMGSIEVINLSAFPVFVSEIGFQNT